MKTTEQFLRERAEVQAKLYAGVRVRVPLSFHLRPVSSFDQWPGGHRRSLSSWVIGIEGWKGERRTGTQLAVYTVRADWASYDPDGAIEEIWRSLVRVLDPEEHFRLIRLPYERRP